MKVRKIFILILKINITKYVEGQEESTCFKYSEGIVCDQRVEKGLSNYNEERENELNNSGKTKKARPSKVT
jgi:hypothetical protein